MRDLGTSKGISPDRRRDLRWRGALDALGVVRRQPGITRAELARRAGLSSGSATEITARLRELALLVEAPAPVTGRGRPTTVLAAHPRGPLVLAVDLRHEDWRLALGAIDGSLADAGAGRHRRRDPGAGSTRSCVRAVPSRLRRSLRQPRYGAGDGLGVPLNQHGRRIRIAAGIGSRGGG